MIFVWSGNEMRQHSKLKRLMVQLIHQSNYAMKHDDHQLNYVLVKLLPMRSTWTQHGIILHFNLEC
jgi:hypothetical protein